MEYQIIIDDYIGDWWASTDKQSIRHKLDKYKDQHVDVKISSLGGSLDDGLDIRQQFLDHGDVTAHLSGFCASAATVIAMGAKHIVMGKYALFLVHQCSNAVFVWEQMNADDMQALIDQLQKNKADNEKIDMVLAAMYASRCKGHTQEELLELLKESKWLTAQEALEWGFIDEISDESAADAPQMTNALAKKFNAAGLPLNGLEIQPDNGGNALRHIFDALKSIKDLITLNNSNQAAIDSSTKNNITMKFEILCALLAVEAFNSEEGQVTLTADQLQAIENRLNELQSQHTADADAIAERDNTIAALNEQIANLQAQPADETNKVDEASEENLVAPVNSIDMYNQIKDIL